MQAFAITWDEFVYHRKRGLPPWERISHPIDTLAMILCLLVPILSSPTRDHLILFALLGAISSLLTTKDEKIHATRCDWKEHWLHSLLFIVHPLVLVAAAYFWTHATAHPRFAEILSAQVALMSLFLVYQIMYWGFYGSARDQ
jgi:small-conductance mechanosensitive channel